MAEFYRIIGRPVIKQSENKMESSKYTETSYMEPTMEQTHWVTALEKDEWSVQWTINDFSFYTKEMNKEFIIEFSNSSNPEIKWSLMLKPVSSTYVVAYLHLKESNLHSIAGQVMFSVIDRNKQQCLTSKSNHLFRKGPETRFHNYFERVRLTVQSEALLPNDTLTITCKVCVFKDSHTKQIPNISSYIKCLNRPRLLPSIESKRFTDFTLVVEGKEITAHKHILCTYSDVFLAMFNSDMEEHKTNRVEIVDISFETVTNMVKFLYGGSIPPYGENTMELLKAADKYNVEALKWEIENEILKTVSPSNACYLLNIAYTYELTRTKELIQKFHNH